MRSSKQKITRRDLLATPAALAVSSVVLPRSARALGSSLLEPSKANDLGKAAMLSARHCAHYGFPAAALLPRAFEADLLLNDPELLRDVAVRAADIIAQGSFDPRHFSRLELVVAPELSHGSRRVWAFTEPQDAVTYLTLAVLIAPFIEARKIPVTDNVVYSHRFLPGRHRLYDERFSVASFRAAARQRAEADGFIVITDLANCFGRLGNERMAAALERCGVPGWQVEYVGQLLGFWQYRDGQGLPIGSNASRILAEAVLLQVDDRLRAAGINYIRYMDDFLLFAPDQSAAHVALEAARDAAASEGFGLKADKTSILRFAKATTDGDPERGLRERNLQRLAGSASFTDGLPRDRQRANATEIRMLQSVRAAPGAGSFLQGKMAAVPQLRRAIRRAIYAVHSDFLRAIPQLLSRYPEIGGFVAFELSQASDFVPEDVRTHLRDEFAAMLLDQSTPDFLAVKLIGILSHSDYRDRAALERLARARAMNPRGIAFRAVLDALRNTGGVTPDLVSRFEEMDGWAKRSVLMDPTCRSLITYSSAKLDLIAAKLVG